MQCASCRHENPDAARFCNACGAPMSSGGGPLENVLVRVVVADGPSIQRYELFDIGDADQALARFDALCSERTHGSADSA